MAIEFHCEHCGMLIKAPEGSGGRTGRCPHCHVEIYVPMPMEPDSGELELAPLSEEDERRRREADAELKALQRKLLKDQNLPGEKQTRRPETPGKPQARAETGTASARQLNTLVVAYIDAMSSGQLERAEKILPQLAANAMQVLSIIDEMFSGDLTGYGLPGLPKPVLQGFLKQLRNRL